VTSKAKVLMYATRFCPYCVRARQMLDSKGVTYQEINVDNRPDLRAQMREKSGRHTVPQIWVGDTHVGGFDDMWLLEQSGVLDTLLARE
jgi:glutaredoxin 3